MAYELEGINSAHSFGDETTFNVFHWPPIVDYCRTVVPDTMGKVNDWHMNDGQGLERTDAAELGRLLMLSLLDGHFEKVSADFNLDGIYRPIQIDELDDGVLQGYSAALNLTLRWEQGQLGWYDPKTEHHIATFNTERARPDNERARADIEHEAHMATEARAAAAEARIRELETRLYNPNL